MVVAECKRHNREEGQKTFTMNAWYYGNESIGGSALTVCRVCLKESDEKKKQKQKAKKKNITINPRPRSAIVFYSHTPHRTSHRHSGVSTSRAFRKSLYYLYSYFPCVVNSTNTTASQRQSRNNQQKIHRTLLIPHSSSLCPPSPFFSRASSIRERAASPVVELRMCGGVPRI